MTGCIEPLFGAEAPYRRIYPDLPGMGKSPANPSIHNAEDLLEVLRLFIRQVIGEEDFLLVGQSYGGYLSLGLIHSLPDPVAGLFLLCPCTVSDRGARRLPTRVVVKEQISPIPAAEEEAFREFAGYAAVLTDETWARYRAEILPGLICADSTFTDAYQANGYGFSFEGELRGALSFHGPACFLTGAMDDCVGYEDAFVLMPGFSRATFATVDGAGHNLQIEAPETFRFFFLDWLERTASMP